MLSGDNSILFNATKAKKDKAMGDVKEQVLLAINTAFRIILWKRQRGYSAL